MAHLWWAGGGVLSRVKMRTCLFTDATTSKAGIHFLLTRDTNVLNVEIFAWVTVSNATDSADNGRRGYDHRVYSSGLTADQHFLTSYDHSGGYLGGSCIAIGYAKVTWTSGTRRSPLSTKKYGSDSTGC
jgi:hypothetical protein